MKTLMFAAAMCALAIVAPQAFAGDAVELSWSFEKDQTLVYKISQRSEVTFDIPRQGPSSTVVQLDLTPVMDVSSVKSGAIPSASLKCVYDAVVFHLEVPNMGGLHFDSTSEAERQAARMDKFKAGLLGLATAKMFKFTCTMAANGGLSKVSGHNRYVPRAFNPQSYKDPVLAAAGVLCQQILTDKAVEETMNEVFPPMPEESSLPGDKWQGESAATIYPLGRVLFESDYTFKEIRDGKIAVISCTSMVRKDPSVEAGFGLPPKDDPTWGLLKDALKKMTILESKREGEFEFDLEKKVITKGKMTLEMQVGASINFFGQSTDMVFKVTHTRSVEATEKQEK